MKHIINGDKILLFLGWVWADLYIFAFAKAEEANLVSSDMELLESGKAAKYYILNSFELHSNEELISKL